MASALMEADESSSILENNRIAGLESQILNSQEIIIRLNRELDSALLRIATLENVCSENQNDLHEKRSRIQKLNDEINEREEDNERLRQELFEKDERLKNLDDLIVQLKQHIKQAKQENQDEDERPPENHHELQETSQIIFDRELRELILHDLDDDTNSSNNSPQALIYQYHHNERLKFYNLLQESLTTDDITSLVDSDDILFESLTHLNSLMRLKETLSHDSKRLQHIRSLLHLTNDDNDELIKDFVSKRQCIEYLHTKIDNDYNFTDFDLIKHILHHYFNFQQQQTDLKEYLNLNNDNTDVNYSRILIERSIEANHVERQLNERIQNQEQTIEQLRNQLNEIPDEDQQSIINELTTELNELKQEVTQRKDRLKEITNTDDEETQFNLLQSLTNFHLTLSDKLSIEDNNEAILQRIDDYQLIINSLNSQEKEWTDEITNELIDKLEIMKNAESMVNDLQKRLDEAIHDKQQIKQIADEFALRTNDEDISDIRRIRHSLQSLVNFRRELFDKTQMNTDEDVLQSFEKHQFGVDVESQTTDNDEFYQQINELETSNKIPDEDQQSIINELTTELNELKQELTHRKDRLKEITNTDDEETQFNLLQSLANFHITLSDKLSIEDNNEAILQRIDDYQLIINTLNSQEKEWTDEITNELTDKLETMKNAESMVDDLQKRLDEAIHDKQQIKQIADEFAPKTNDEDISDITRIRHSFQSLINFRQNLFDKTQMNTDEDVLQSFEKHQFGVDVESQTTDNDEFYQQIKELIGTEDDNPEEIINKIQELSELVNDYKKENINELLSNNEKLRNLLNIEDGDLVESVMELNKNFQKLNEEHEKLVQKENNIDKSIERLLHKLGLSSDSSPRTQIDEICIIFDTFCLDYCKLTSTDIEIMNLIEIFKHIQLFLVENNRLKELINQINFDQSSKTLDSTSKLQTYLTKVDTLCQLICDDEANIDQALVVYRKKIEQDENVLEKISDFKQQLLTRLSIDNEEQIFDRLDEIEQLNTDFKEKLQHNDDVSSTVTSLNITVSEQRKKILEHEETLEKLRSQRERMLAKMKDMKSNNEILADQLKQSNSLRDELHRKEIDYKNQIEEIEQQLRSANNQIQVSSDECRTQQDLQETMKLEIESIKNEIETQRKLYESRCRQIINEKNQLDKNKKEIIEQKQLFEDENKRLQTILHTIKDTLENVDDVHSIVDTILKLRQDHLTLTSELNKTNDRMHVENEKLLLNIHQQQSTIDEYIQTNNQLEKRLIDNEQQIINLKQEIQDNIHQYQRLQNEYQLYKEDNQIKKNSQVAVINIEESPPPPQPQILPVQHTAQSNNWMAIDIKDEEVPLTTLNKHSTIDTPTALFNLLGELKSKLGITLTHRPRSSSVFFVYLCAVHVLTLYLLFIRHC